MKDIGCLLRIVCTASLIASLADNVVVVSAQQPVTQLKVMTFNVWVDGGRVNSGTDKVVSAIQQSGADIVGLQESSDVAAFVAFQLGWYWHQSSDSVAVVSRFPIVGTFPKTQGAKGVGVRLSLSDDPPQDLIVWTCHLTAYPYGPYDACFEGKSVAQILRSVRRTQLKDVDLILTDMAPHLSDADNTPVLFVGDFNTPSHRDWVAATADTHCGYAISYPVTEALEAEGLIDAYRTIHPDPGAFPGNTWTPVSSWNFDYNAPEPQDRIDMIHYKGQGLSCTNASVFVTGNPSEEPNHGDNEWPSDHACVIADFDVVLGGGGGPCTPTDLHVGSIQLSTQSIGKGQKNGAATVTVVDDCGAPVADANVNGAFTGDFNESVSATTDGSGAALLVTSGTVKGNPSFEFCVNEVTVQLLAYDGTETCDST